MTFPDGSTDVFEYVETAGGKAIYYGRGNTNLAGSRVTLADTTMTRQDPDGTVTTWTKADGQWWATSVDSPGQYGITYVSRQAPSGNTPETRSLVSGVYKRASDGTTQPCPADPATASALRGCNVLTLTITSPTADAGHVPDHGFPGREDHSAWWLGRSR